MIYWLRAGDTEAVKVGYAARDVAARMKLLQCGCFLPLVLLRTVPGGRDLEAALHRHYRAKHFRAEWFLLDGREVEVDLSTVARLSPKELSERRVRQAGPHDEIIKALGGPTAVARLLGVSEKSPLHWGARGIPSAYWHVIAALPMAREMGISAKSLASTSLLKRAA